MQYTHNVSTPMGPNVILYLAEDQGQKEWEDITDYQAVMGSSMYTELATRPDILSADAALSRYNLWPCTSYMTAAKRILPYFKSTAGYRMHFNGINIGNDLIGYSDSDWANDSADHKPQGDYVFLTKNGAIS